MIRKIDEETTELVICNRPFEEIVGILLSGGVIGNINQLTFPPDNPLKALVQMFSNHTTIGTSNELVTGREVRRGLGRR